MKGYIFPVTDARCDISLDWTNVIGLPGSGRRACISGVANTRMRKKERSPFGDRPCDLSF